MLRAILGVIVGFIVMMVGVMIVFGVTMAVLGSEGTYRPATYWTSDKFNVIVLVGGTVVAAVGGLVCALISRSRKALLVFVVLLLVFGAFDAFMQSRKPDPPPATGAPTIQQIMEHGKEPTWFTIAKSLLGAAGVMLGGWSLAKPKKPS